MLAGLFERRDFRDPELAEAHITVTEVRIGPDLRHATAFVARLGRSDVDALLPALKRATPFLRGQVAQALRLRFAPDLSFQPDHALEYATKIDRLLHARGGARFERPSTPRPPRGEVTIATEGWLRTHPPDPLRDSGRGERASVSPGRRIEVDMHEPGDRSCPQPLTPLKAMTRPRCCTVVLPATGRRFVLLYDRWGSRLYGIAVRITRAVLAGGRCDPRRLRSDLAAGPSLRSRARQRRTPG